MKTRSAKYQSCTLAEFTQSRMVPLDNVERAEAAASEVYEAHVQALGDSGFPDAVRESLPPLFYGEGALSAEYIQAWWLDMKRWMSSLGQLHQNVLGSTTVCWKDEE